MNLTSLLHRPLTTKLLATDTFNTQCDEPHSLLHRPLTTTLLATDTFNTQCDEPQKRMLHGCDLGLVDVSLLLSDATPPPLNHHTAWQSLSTVNAQRHEPDQHCASWR